MPAAKKIGYAVVGLGSIAKSSVLPAFRNCKHAELIAVIGRDKKKAEPLAKKFKAKTVFGVANYAECLSNPNISAVYIATPQGAHLDLCVQAAQLGKHVLCEKPLAATVAQAEAIVDACRSSGVRLMTAYRKYFEPSTLYIKELVQSGALGRVDVIHTAFSELHVRGRSLAWLLSASLAGGGPLMDLGVYCTNTCRWIVGEDPVEVIAQTWRNDRKRFNEVEEGITFRLRFPSGMILHGSSSYGAALSSFIFIQGTKGWLSLAPAFPFDEPRVLTGKINARWFEKKFRVVDEFAPEIDAFAQSILKKLPIEPDGVQGLRDVRILHSIYESAKIQKPLAIQC
jgi:predicted dehydrogenase